MANTKKDKANVSGTAEKSVKKKAKAEPAGKAKKALDEADVILAKGQGNYETMSDQGRHIFYEFLCKCDLFTSRFKVPRLTGVFTEEK